MSTELAIITPAEMQTAVEIFTRNDQWLSKYEASHQKLIDKAKKEGEKLSPDTDKKLNEWQVSARQCIKQMKEDRMVYTSKMDEIKKEFTSLENRLEKDLYSQMQTIRDKSISIYAKEQREKEAEEAKKLQKEQERINLLADAEQQVRNAYADILRADKDELFDAFNGCDANTIDGVEELLKGIDTVFKIDRWDAIVPILSSNIHTKEELENIILNAKAGKFDAVAPHYKTEIDNYAKYLLSLLPQRRKELAKGEAESKAAAELATKQREVEAAQQAAQDAKIDAEIAEALKAAELDSKIETEKAKAPAKAIESYDIEVLSSDGWMQIFQLWFRDSGVKTEEMGKFKLDQMKAWCEKHAKSNGVFIEHSSVKYVEKYKAVTRKASKKVSV